MEERRRAHNEFRFYRCDEFMVKFLSPGKRGVNVVVQMRRKERRPNTLSLYEIPIFECNTADFEEDFDTCARALAKAMMDHSQNVREIKLTQYPSYKYRMLPPALDEEEEEPKILESVDGEHEEKEEQKEDEEGVEEEELPDC